MKGAEEVTFGGSGLDRAAHLRSKPEAIQSLLEDDAARVLPFWRGKPLIGTGAAGWIALDHPLAAEAVEAPVFLGLDDGAPRFAIDVSAWQPGEVPESVGAFVDPSEQRYPGLPDDQRLAELRMHLTAFPPREAELMVTAKAVLGWHYTHGFCARCGARTVIGMAGWQRDCPDCDAHHFPRTDPVVIMLITQGESVLMGRSPGWPDGMYSLLAGFVEPGEPIEAAVRREVFEEAGIKVGAVEYLSSQPWPFPSSLMFGCRGEALTRDITVDPAELEDALWVTRQEMVDVVSGNHLKIKPGRKGAIARFLIDRWLEDRLD